MRLSETWRADLMAWAREVTGEPYEWGRTDCAALMRDGLRVMATDDPLPDAPEWTDAASASQVEAESGGVAAWMERAGLGVVEALTLLRPGDVVTWPSEEHPGISTACAILVGPSRLLASYPDRGVVVAQTTARALADLGATGWRAP